jgi:PD-(D/E)XK endonuclease
LRKGRWYVPLIDRSQNTSKIGEITESLILARLVQLGYECLIPWGHDHRYDIAIDDDGKLVRIQCKTARYVKKWGCLEFNTAITYARVGGKPHIRKGYQGEADYFGVYSPDSGKGYLVPVDDVPIGSKAKLRLDATKNNQQKGVKWARVYEI